MGITVTATEVLGRDEAVIRDNIENPDTGLFDRAVGLLVQPMYNQTYQRAQQKYAEVASNGTATEKKALPLYTDREAMIDWLTTRTGYLDATAIYIAQRTEALDLEITRITNERDTFQNRLNALDGESPTYAADAKHYQDVIAVFNQQIADKEAELAALQPAA